MSTTRRTRAFHESGHAIVAHVLGKRVELVSIEPTGKTDGFCLWMEHSDPVFEPGAVASAAQGIATSVGAPRQRPDYSADERATRAMIALAGPQAHRRYGGFSRGAPGASEQSDDRQAREILSVDGASDYEVTYMVSEARSAASELVNAHWSEIEAVADALEASGTLDRQQFATLMGAVTGELVGTMHEVASVPQAAPVATAAPESAAEWRQRTRDRIAAQHPLLDGLAQVYFDRASV